MIKVRTVFKYNVSGPIGKEEQASPLRQMIACEENLTDKDSRAIADFKSNQAR